MRNSAPAHTNWFEALLPVKLCCPTRQLARGSFPETLDLKSAWHCATATDRPPHPHCLPSGPHPPRVGAHLPPCNLTPIACSPGFGAACLFPPCSFKFVFLGSFVWFSLRRGLVWFLCLVERFLGVITTGCMRPFVPRTDENEITTLVPPPWEWVWRVVISHRPTDQSLRQTPPALA